MKKFWFKINPEKGPLFIHNCGNQLVEKRGQHGERSLVCPRCGFEAPVLFFQNDVEWELFVRFLKSIKKEETRTVWKTGYSNGEFEIKRQTWLFPMVVLKRIS